MSAVPLLVLIVGEEFSLPGGDPFAIELSEFSLPFPDQLQGLSAAPLGASEHPFRVCFLTGLRVGSETVTRTNRRVAFWMACLGNPGAMSLRPVLSLGRCEVRLKCSPESDLYRLAMPPYDPENTIG